MGSILLPQPKTIVDFLVNPPFPEYFFVLKVIFILFALYFIGGIIYYIKTTSYLQVLYGESLTELILRRPYGVKNVNKSWEATLKKMESGSEADWKLAIIEADSLLDDSLKRIGYSGDTLREKLNKLTPYQMPNLAELREAHIVRSDIVRDPDYTLSKGEAKKIFAIYEQSLRELEVI